MPWKPGESGNPAGRPVGTKNKFSRIKEAFTEAFERTGGVEGLVKWIQEQPKNQGDFYRLLASMMPRDVTLETTDHRRAAIEYSTAELLQMRDELNEDRPEDEPTKRIAHWPKTDRQPGEPPRQTEVASASVVEDTGPVDGDGS